MNLIHKPNNRDVNLKVYSGIHFDAPWSLSLKLVTTFSAAILLGVPAIGLFSGPSGSITWIMSMIVMPLMILVVAVFFLIRGYVLTPRMLLVQRLGWNSKLSLENFVSATHDPQAMTRSLRLFGNGGLFCFAGKFRNKRLGTYQAYATAPKSAVVLTFSDRTVVVTPSRPDQFVTTIRRLVSQRT